MKNQPSSQVECNRAGLQAYVQSAGRAFGSTFRLDRSSPSHVGKHKTVSMRLMTLGQESEICLLSPGDEPRRISEEDAPEDHQQDTGLLVCLGPSRLSQKDIVFHSDADRATGPHDLVTLNGQNW